MDAKIKCRTLIMLPRISIFVLCCVILFFGVKYFLTESRHITAFSNIAQAAMAISCELDYSFSEEDQYPKSIANVADTIRREMYFGLLENRTYELLDAIEYTSDGESYEMTARINLYYGNNHYFKQSGHKGKRIFCEIYRDGKKVWWVNQ